MRGMGVGLFVVAVVVWPAERRARADQDPGLARIPFATDAAFVIDLSLMATAAGRLELARAAAERAVELAPREVDAYLALALAQRAAGQVDAAGAQVAACRTARGDDGAACAAIERALAGDAVGKQAADAALARRAAAPAVATAPAAGGEPAPARDEDEVAFEDSVERAARAAAEACVEVSRWNHVYVRLEVGSTAGQPTRVDMFDWEAGDDDLRECVEASLARAHLPGRPYGASATMSKVDFEATGKLRPRWFWRIRPAVLVYGLADAAGDRGLAGLRGAMAILDKPFLQPIVHVDGEIGSTEGGREGELVGRLGFGFARDPFAGGLTAGAGVSRIGDAAPAALVVPVELWIDYRVRGAGLLAWARNSFSPAEERRGGAEHATLDATALQLGTGLRIPALWRGGLLLGIRYDERLGEERIAVWLGTEWRASRF
ncbi:MAG TPA: hypothetical protein VFU21_15600 [Kofleriaceae bacterium]|nr:hypothetical protein [Kofleriaceae bacterium]